jgi:hypothetical protein
MALILAGSIISCSFNTPAPKVPSTKPKTQPPATVENQQPAETPSSETAAEDESGWTFVKTFIGKENQTTAAFTISGTKWRITWAIESQSTQYAVFNIMVFSRDAPTMLIKRIECSPSTSSGTAYIDEGGREYYLKIIAANLTNWNITIDDYTGGISAAEPVQITHIWYKGEDFSAAMASNHEIIEWDEYIEIKNTTYSPQNIGGWTLKNITKGQPVYTFPTFKPCNCNYLGSWQKCVDECYPARPDVIEPRESIRVYTGEAHWESGGYCFYYNPGDVWNNVTPDTAVLYDADGKEVSRRSYIIPADNSDPSTK